VPCTMLHRIWDQTGQLPIRARRPSCPSKPHEQCVKRSRAKAPGSEGPFEGPKSGSVYPPRGGRQREAAFTRWWMRPRFSRYQAQDQQTCFRGNARRRATSSQKSSSPWTSSEWIALCPDGPSNALTAVSA